MKRIILIAFITFILAGCTCDCSTPTPTITPYVVTATPDPIIVTELPVTDQPTPVIIEPTATATIPQYEYTPTPITSPESTPTPPPAAEPVNLWIDPSFENECEKVVFGEVCVVNAPITQPAYCAETFTPEECDAKGQGVINSDNLKQGRPEYQPTRLQERVHSGDQAQKWFCFYRPCTASVFQIIPTTPGQQCDVEAWMMLWSEDGKNPDGSDSFMRGYWGMLPDLSGPIFGPIPSSDKNPDNDDDIAATARIVVRTDGDPFPFNKTALKSRRYGMADGMYDNYKEMTYSFIANSDSAAVFIRAEFLFPFAHNDAYLDDVSVVCHEPDGQGGGGAAEDDPLRYLDREEITFPDSAMPDQTPDKPIWPGLALALGAAIIVLLIVIVTKRIQVLFLGVAGVSVLATTAIQGVVTMPFDAVLFQSFVESVLGFVPIVPAAATLIVIIVDVAKRLLPDSFDGYAGLLSLFLNAIAWVGIYFATAAGHEGEALTLIEQITGVAVVLVPLLFSLAGTKGLNEFGKWLGVSYSNG